jgi:hypothetical protein
VPVHVRIDEHADRERERADDDVDDLPLQVVVRVARDVEARDAGDRPEADGDEAGDARDEHPVERAQEGADREPLAVPLQPCSL